MMHEETSSTEIHVHWPNFIVSPMFRWPSLAHPRKRTAPTRQTHRPKEPGLPVVRRAIPGLREAEQSSKPFEADPTPPPSPLETFPSPCNSPGDFQNAAVLGPAGSFHPQLPRRAGGKWRNGQATTYLTGYRFSQLAVTAPRKACSCRVSSER